MTLLMRTYPLEANRCTGVGNPSTLPYPCSAFTFIELLVVIALIAVLAGLLLPALGRSKAKAHNAACVNNLRQLGIATRAYADENQERLPSAEILPTQPIDPQNPLPRICDVLASYVGRTGGPNTNSATVFKCPVDKMGRFAAEGSSYEWNADLNGHRIDETQTTSAFLLLQRWNPSGGITNFVLTFPPGTTPLFLDYDEFHPRPPKSGKNVVFMDGHVAPLEATRDDSE
jgi:prepilin-type N-terminal cleavage/methylation domain-containing protein/prepilin-type processing-associated H-X9-DG protein